jgi:hypothetical protein
VILASPAPATAQVVPKGLPVFAQAGSVSPSAPPVFGLVPGAPSSPQFAVAVLKAKTSAS